MFKENDEDVRYTSRLLALKDEAAFQWIQKKGMELQQLMTYY